MCKYTNLSPCKNKFLVFVEIFIILIYNLLCINMENFMDKKKYLILTYGCQMNVHESEKLAGILESNGYEVCDNAVDADIVVFCGLQCSFLPSFEAGQKKVTPQYRNTCVT